MAGVGGEEGAELLGEMEQDGAGLEEADRFRAAAIEQCGDFGVGIDCYETAAELIAVVDADQPGVVLGTFVAEGQQLFQHYGDLDAVRRGQRVELKRVTADREVFFVRGTGDGAVDIGEMAAAGLFPGPNLRGRIFGGIGHVRCSSFWRWGDGSLPSPGAHSAPGPPIASRAGSLPRSGRG